ncbi:MAG TPA: hypothetical protein VNK67_15465 [Burkholderiales bacterium]|nr:hypothetical protein [Burkholderiales bacterium]
MDSKLEKTVHGLDPEYGLDVLCASWNPLVAALAEPMQACHEFVAEIASADAESFLARFYTCQQG